VSYAVRKAEAADWPELKKMVGELHDSVSVFCADLAPTALILDPYFASLEARIAKYQGAFYVAANGDQLGGYVCVLGATPPDCDERPEPVAIVTDLYVRDVCRGLGIGRALLAQAEDHGRACSAYKLELNVLSGNTAARSFYGREGYGERVIVQSKHL